MKTDRIIILSLLLLCACVKVQFGELANPNPQEDPNGPLMLTTDWSDHPVFRNTDEKYIVNVVAEKELKYLDTTVNLPDLSIGNHRLVVYNEAHEHITINKTTAIIDEVETGVIYGNLDLFFCGSITFKAEPSKDTTSLYVKMVKSTGLLRFIFTIEGINIDAIQNVDAKLTGVSNKLDMVTGDVVEKSYASVKPQFIVLDGKLIADLDLFGIDKSTSQILNLTIQLDNGSFITISPLNVSDKVKNFNSIKKDGLILENTLYIESLNGAFSSKIGNWKIGSITDIIL